MSSRTLPFILVAAGLALAATGASGKDAIELSPPGGRPGRSVLARGAFSENPDDVTVRVGGAKVQVFELAADRLRFLVPLDAKEGPLEVEVVVKGFRSRTTYQVLEKDLAGENVEVPAPPAPPLIRDAKLEVRERKAVVTAATDLKDGFSVAVVFGYVSSETTTRELTLATTKTRVKGGKVAVELGPFEGEVLGRYFASLVFELARQPAALQAGWTREPLASARAFAVVGSEARLAEHEAAVEAHYRGLAARTGAVRSAVERACAAACQKDPKDRRFLRGERLDAEAWRLFVEEDVWKPLRALEADEESFGRRWLGARRERASVAARDAVREVERLVQRFSKELHDWHGLEVPASIREPRGR